MNKHVKAAKQIHERLQSKTMKRCPSQDTLDSIHYFPCCPVCHEGLDSGEMECPACKQTLDWTGLI